MNFKDKDKIFKYFRPKDQITYKGKIIRLASDFKKSTNQGNNGAGFFFKASRRKVCIKDINPANLYFRIEGNTATVLTTQNLRNHTAKPV